MCFKKVIEKKHGVRLFKSLLLVSAAILLSSVFAGNVFLYDINFEYVEHIMSMDDTFHHPSLMLRAINDPIYYHIAYILIIVLEGLASIFLWMGVYHIFKNLSQTVVRFEQAKYWGMMGLLFALLIYGFVFFGIAGEWFASWQSIKWNAKSASLPFIFIFGMIYLIFSQTENHQENKD